MTSLDAAIVVIVAACALRGFWRGFFRESFGILALIAGTAAALQFTALGQVVLAHNVSLPEWLTEREELFAALVFVAIFAAVHSLFSVMGALLDRLAAGSLLRALNHVGGVFMGACKGTALIAFGLLFLHLFPFIPTADQRIMESSIGQPMVAVAGDVLRLGMRSAGEGRGAET